MLIKYVPRLKTHKDIILYSIVVFFIAVFVISVSNGVLLVDEKVHSNQILNFQKKNFEHFNELTTFTTYHHIIAIISNLLQTETIQSHRLINLFFSIIMMFIFYVTISKFYKKNRLIRSFQFVFTPIIFPFYYLVYTDIMALTFFLFAVYFYTNNKLYWSLLFASLSVFIRQPSLMWFVLIPSIQFFCDYNFKSINAIKKVMPWAIVVLLFMVYFVFNGGVALGDKTQHHITLNITNFYFLILVAFIVFLPLLLARYKEVYRKMLNTKWLLLLLLFSLPIYFYSYSVDHLYNQLAPEYFYRNYILMKINASPILMLVSSFVFYYTIIAISTIELIEKKWNFIFIITFISVIPMPLIEQRYYIIAFAMWQLTRKSVNEKIELITLTWMIILSIYVYINIMKENFFL